MKNTFFPAFLYLLILFSFCLVGNVKSTETICEYDQQAYKFLYQSQYDSALHFYQQLSACKKPEKTYAALIGITRIKLLQLKTKQAELFQQKASELRNQIRSDSLHYAFLLNDAILELLNTKSLRKLTEFINETPETVEDLAEAYIWYIESLLGEERYQESQDALIRANRLLKHHKEKGEKFQIGFLMLQATLYEESSKIKQAVNIYEQQIIPSLSKRKEVWARYQLADAYRISGMMYQSFRNYDKALNNYFSYLKIVRDLHQNSFFRFGEIYFRISSVYEQLGFYNLADEYRIKSAKVYLSLHQENEIFYMRARYNEGLMYKRRKQWPEALAAFDSVVNLDVVKPKSQIYILESLMHKLDIFRITDSFGEFEDTYQQLEEHIKHLKRRQRERYHFRMIYARLDIVEKKEEKDLSAQLYRQLQKQIANKVFIKSTLYLSFMNRLSDHLISQNDPDSALVISESVLRRYRKKLSSPDQNFINNELKHLVRTGFLKGSALKQRLTQSSDRLQLEKVLSCFSEVINWHMLTKEGYKPLEYDIYSETSISDLFGNAINVSYDLYRKTGERAYVEAAFRFSEQSKSNRLLESLRRNLLIQQNRVPDSITIQIRSLKEQVSFLKSELRKLSLKKTGNISDSLKEKEYHDFLLISQEQYRRLMVYLESNHNNYYEANYGRQFISLSAVQQKLKAGEGLVTYFQGSNDLVSFLVTTDTVVIEKGAPIAVDEILSFRNSLIPDSTSLQADDSYRLFVNEGRRMYDRLLKSLFERVGEETKIQKLYIVPDKSLNFLPFEQLLTADTERAGDDYGALPYLIKSYQVSYSASASVLFRPESDRKLPEYSGKLLAFAPTYTTFNNPGKLNESIQFRNSLSALKYNQQEVEAIMDHLSGSMLTGHKATEKRFYRQFNEYDILHFAMHGLVDLKEPQFSRLAFAEDQTDSVNDNYLHNFEIYNMDIPAQLVVLSACNTGIGQLIDGEGVMSMSRAFTYAGVQSVVMTQWPAEDQSSSEVMQSFYKHLSNGKAKDEALRLAKLDFLTSAHPFKKNPFYWNNFIISGQVQPLQIKKRDTYLWWVVFGAIALLSIVFLNRYRKAT